MIWPFSRKPASPAPSTPLADTRIWNEDWKVGDTAECIEDNWHESVHPWERPKKGQRLTVIGFSEGKVQGKNCIAYFLKFEGFRSGLETKAFRKVLPITKAEESEIGAKILNAKPAPDRKRKVQA